MNALVMVFSFFLGAQITQPPTGGNSDIPGIAAPTDSVPLQPELRSAVQRHKAQQQRSNRPYDMGPPSSRRSAEARQPTGMPFAPTDNRSDTEQQYQYIPPTAAAPEGSTAPGGRPTGFYGPSRVPYSPTHPRPGQAASNASMRDAQLQQMRLESAHQVATSPTQANPKAFAGTQMNTGGSSPYMNIFRGGTNNGTIDNYTTLVRPQLDQRRTNQQFGADINSLEMNSRVQGFHINQLNRETQNLQGVKAQQYFMNYGDYYPSAR
jgi:hypothetical protein